MKFALLLLLAQEEDKENRKFYGRYTRMLTLEERRRRDRRIPRSALRPHCESPFRYLFNSGNDQGLINATGLDFEVFNELLTIFHPLTHEYCLDEKDRIKMVTKTRNGTRKGRRRSIDSTGILGLVLMWYRTRGSCARGLSFVFGLTSTTLYRWLNFGRRLLLSALIKHPSAKVCLPTQDEFNEYAAAINEKYRYLQNVWGACDGLKTHIERPGNDVTQNRFYNGWIHGHYINSVFVFAPDGRIRACITNCPGAWHDSTQADYHIYNQIAKVYEQFGGKIVVDSAFNALDHPFLIKSQQIDPTDPLGVIVNRQATSVRQLSEWGMRMIKGQFPRLDDKLRWEDLGYRRIIMNLAVLLYNFQTTKIGINQILNTYMYDQTSYFGWETISEDANSLLPEFPEEEGAQPGAEAAGN